MRYGRLVVIEDMGVYQDKDRRLKVQCDCGTIKVVRQKSLRCGDTVSCGCARIDLNRRRAVKHGMAGTRIYRIWKNMCARCICISNRNYNDYGARGIDVDEKWQDFSTFYADVGDPPAGMTLDRPDNDSGYGPRNWRWATRQEQARNRRSNRRVRINHVEMTISEWSEMLGLDQDVLRKRLNRGWSARKALTTPVRA